MSKPLQTIYNIQLSTKKKLVMTKLTAKLLIVVRIHVLGLKTFIEKNDFVNKHIMQ